MSTSTQLVTSSAEPCFPWIPPELISLILTMLWEAPQTLQERTVFFKRNVALVNRTWLALAAHITSRDVHISNYRNACAFLRYLSKYSPAVGDRKIDLFSMEANHVAKQICRSITFHVNGVALPDRLFDHTSAFWGCDRAVSKVLRMVATVYSVPNIRHISLQYTDCAYDSIFDQINEWGFPKQVTHLSLDYSFTDPAKVPPFDLSRTVRWTNVLLRGLFPAFIPHLRHLSLSGVPAGLVVAMLCICPNIETLEITNPGPQPVSALAPLPPAVRTLVLRRPGVALSRKEMMSWELFPALDRGLFRTRGTKPRVVVCSGTPDPVAFTELRRSCKCLDAELVYERDDARSQSF